MKQILYFSIVTLILLTVAVFSQAQVLVAGSNKSTKITLTAGEKVIPAILYNNPAAKDLLARLPVTVSLNRGPVDYCGGIAPLKYAQKNAQPGYQSGNLAYWIPGQDFVIFTESKKAASYDSPDLVIIGQIRADIKEIKDLSNTIKVTIALDR